MQQPMLRRIWGSASGVFYRAPSGSWVDALLVIGLAGLFLGLVDLGIEWTGQSHATVEIDLSPTALPQYTFFSLARGFLAYGFSLTFTLCYGYWAAKDATAEKILMPLLDILQSIPVLGFMPGFVIALVAIFPHSNIGLELAAVLMIFTGQAWNMTFSFFHSLRSVPDDLKEAATVYRFGWWQKFRCVELPFATVGLVWNSMMSMAGGWFFLTISESFKLGDRDFHLPGLGSYMSVAVEEGRTDSMLWAIFAMILMVVLIDQLFWRPIVVWAQKFRVEESGGQEIMSSWFLNHLRKSHILAFVESVAENLKAKLAPFAKQTRLASVSGENATKSAALLSRILFGAVLLLLIFGGWKLCTLLRHVSPMDWLAHVSAGGWTLGRVLISTALGTLWALPAGLAIGLSPRLSRVLQPVVQVVASFPAPMLFPIVIAGLQWAGISLGWGSILLMLLGTQWYILFNVIAGAMAIPTDLREMAVSFRIGRIQKFWNLYLPSVFPFLVTGWLTAAGGAWNASIVAEFVTFKNQTIVADGLGAQISKSAASGDFPQLAASILVMCAIVVLFNRAVWRRCYRLAENRYSLNR